MAPKETEMNAFSLGLRKRNRSKEVGPEWRYRPKHSIERIFDTLKDRDLGHFNPEDIANAVTTQRMTTRRATSTLGAYSRKVSPKDSQ